MEPLVVFTVVIRLGLLLSLSFILYFLHRNQQRKVVFSTSHLIQSLLTLNAQYIFFYNIQKQYKEYKLLSSKQKYDKYDCEDLFDEAISSKYHYYSDIANKLQKNYQSYEDYCSKVKQLKSTLTQELAAQLHISYTSYKEIEVKLFHQQLLTPITSSEIICIATYTSPKGRNRYSKQVIHSIFDVDSRYQVIQATASQRNSVQEQKKRERAKMSDSLRYDILRRDGFKCQICGRTQADGVKLHIDHVIPIAKGGKTVKENLRTLCDQCNLGKRDKTE